MMWEDNCEKFLVQAVFLIFNGEKITCRKRVRLDLIILKFIYKIWKVHWYVSLDRVLMADRV